MSDIEDGELNYNKMGSIDVEEERISKYILITNKGAKTKMALVKKLDNKVLIPQFNLSIIRCDEQLLIQYIYSLF